MRPARLAIALAGLVLILGLTNWDIAQKRAVIADGELLMLELRPVDPRSLLQGDYMALALADAVMPDSTAIESLPYRGTVILSLDENRIGRYARLDDGSPLKDNELRVQYRRHEDWGRPRLDYGAQSFFFQEGQAEVYQAAKYAVLRVAADGGTVLTDLADENRERIRPGPR
ncbi:GDYXXLXY domain-containing protein [Dongia deserti]|uniref:GDYXXLXY domain-containing protein n=1 Tax=Dongia deserti TaxID=2268030 RepID=UPI000E64D801|nr:GDYXXLXY domain-containing protein [Dongia deserti]